MYRVNAKRSQEKNDRSECTQCHTKVTFDRRSRKNFVMHRVPTLIDELRMAHRLEISLSDVRDASGDLLASRSVAALVDIYNRRRFSGHDRLMSGV
jgi:hypothetical protein